MKVVTYSWLVAFFEQNNNQHRSTQQNIRTQKNKNNLKVLARLKFFRFVFYLSTKTCFEKSTTDDNNESDS